MVPTAQIDAGKTYRVAVFNPSGAVVFQSPCRTNFASGDNSYTVQVGDVPSTNGPYIFRVEQYANCGSSQATIRIMNFYVVRAEVFQGFSPTNRFLPGQAASLRIFGLPPNQANWNTTWIKPNGSISCENTAQSDRPDSSAKGLLPATNATFLTYPPSSSAPHTWNQSGNYDSGNCSGFTTNNEGLWSLYLYKTATNFVTLPVFTVASDCVVTTPLTNLTRGVMANALFSTEPTGPGPFTYAWFRNEALIPGETNFSLLLTNLALNDSGPYSVVVTAPCGSTTRTATLTVISCSPSLDVMLVIDRSGSMLGQAYVDARTASTNLIRDLHLGQGDQAGLVSYNIAATLDHILTNDATSLEQAVATLPEPERGTTISLGLKMARNELLSSRHNPYALPVIVLLSDGLPHSAEDSTSNVLYNATLAKNAGMLVFTIAVGESDPLLMSSVASASDTFFFATNSSQFTDLFYIIAALLCRTSTNLVVDGPTNQTVCAGETASFTITAQGCELLRYQWRKNGLTLGGETNATLTFSNTVLADAGTYSVEVRSDCGMVTRSATLAVQQLLTGGEIQSQAVCVGNGASFQSAPSGDEPFSFVWRKDGALIQGATNSSLIIPVAGFGEAGEYTVEIYNMCCAITNAANLTVTDPVTATPINDQIHCVGDIAIFTTTFGETLPSDIIWRKDGVVIPGETNRYLIVPVLSIANAGRYSVEASGVCDTVTN
ncbi:MAG TPA: VWA domain-containing protein, partial [Candidatus Acidoferrum sp.]|nr:VWA domain-containing protein [Candidatus Acidoferrum sp.]